MIEILEATQERLDFFKQFGVDSISSGEYDDFPQGNDVITNEVPVSGGSVAPILSGYQGQFMLSANFSTQKLYILDGGSLGSAFAGHTDIVQNVNTYDFPLSSTFSKKVYAIGLSTGSTYTVSFYLEGSPVSGTYQSDPYELGTISASGMVTQTWTSGPIIFSQTYLV